jgi:iron-sulfur cluster assembly protein
MTAIIGITEAAAVRVKYLMENSGKSGIGIKVGVKSGGCSGLAYTFDFVDEIKEFDEVISYEGIKIIIDCKAVMFLLGTTLDYIDEVTKSGFVFINPNEKSRCGCGKSFKV